MGACVRVCGCMWVCEHVCVCVCVGVGVNALHEHINFCVSTHEHVQLSLIITLCTFSMEFAVVFAQG